MNKPPEGLVPLDTLPRNTWVGRSIYHPMMQARGVPYWRESDGSILPLAPISAVGV